MGASNVPDTDFVDLAVPGHVTIRRDGQGSFQFGAVEGTMDCRLEKSGDDEQISFTWEGFDEGDPVFGRGWVQVTGQQMLGHLFFHQGDDSPFKAKRSR